MTDAAEKVNNHWRQETDSDGVVWLCLDKADGSANVLSSSVLQEFDAILSLLESDPPRGLVIYSGKRNGFIMGADINEFTHIESADQGFDLIRLGQQLFDRLEALRCPSVAALDGFCLGGGLELALACTYRLALDNKKPVLGFPEVQLGLHPGFGGTVRSVRMAGVRNAMPLMLTGKPVRIDKAMRLGLLDRIATPDNWKQAARELLASGKAKTTAPFIDKFLNLFFMRPIIGRILRRGVSARVRRAHYPSPYAIIDLWVRYGARGAPAYEAEARSFADLMLGNTSRNLVRVFFLQNRLKSQGNKAPARIERVHVVGAGVMGGDIAAWCAVRGLQVTLQDRAQEYIDPALERAEKLFSKRFRNEQDRTEASSRLKADIDGDGVADADLVIEAIYENLEAKQALYQTLQGEMKSDAVLATNTSSIPLEDLRTVLDAPDRFVGLHFFNPVAKLPLVEVIRCEDTQQSVVDTGLAFVKGIGKFPLVCASSPGFVVNRVLAPYLAEAMHLVQEGVSPSAIDRAAEQFGMPMGPIELIDSIGLDVAIQVAEVLGAGATSGQSVPDTVMRMVEQKQLGRKTGQGFYAWEHGKALKPADEGGDAPPDIVDRLILPLVNEAVACLSEGVVPDADLLDAGIIFGTGFAPFRGGPLQYARDRGIDDVTRTLDRLADAHGERFRSHGAWANIRGEAKE